MLRRLSCVWALTLRPTLWPFQTKHEAFFDVIQLEKAPRTLGGEGGAATTPEDVIPLIGAEAGKWYIGGPSESVFARFPLVRRRRQSYFHLMLLRTSWQKLDTIGRPIRLHGKISRRSFHQRLGLIRKQELQHGMALRVTFGGYNCFLTGQIFPSKP